MAEADGNEDTRRAEILRTATALFLRDGYAGTSINAVAPACGLRKSSLYHHFAGKEALFVACVTDGYDAAIARLERIRDEPGIPAPERLARALDEIYAVTVAEPVGRLSPLIAEVSLRFPAIARMFHDGFIRRQHAVMGEIVAGGVAEGRFRDRDRAGLMHLIFGPVVTLSLSRQMFASLPDLDAAWPVDRLRREHLDALLELLAPPGRDGAS